MSGALPWKLCALAVGAASLKHPNSTSFLMRDAAGPCPTCHVYSYDSWRDPIRNGDCHDFTVSSAGFSDTVRCNLEDSKEGDAVTQKLTS